MKPSAVTRNGVLGSGALLAGASIAAWLLVAIFNLSLLAALMTILALLGIGYLLPSPRSMVYGLGLLMVTVTIDREGFGLPYEIDLLGFGLLFGALLWQVPWRVLLGRWPLLFWVAAAYVLTNLAATVLNAPDLPFSLRQTLILGYRLTMFLMVVLAIEWERSLIYMAPRLLLVVMVGQTLVSLGAMLIYSFLPTPLVLYGKDGNAAIALNGFFQEPNLYGIFCLCVVAIMLCQVFFDERQSRPRLIGALGIGIVGIALSYTRSTWIGLMLVVLALAVIILSTADRRTKRRFLIIGSATTLPILAVGAVLIALFDQEGFLSSRFADIVSLKTSSSIGRLQSWQAAVERWQEHPWIGSGPLSFGTQGTSVDGWLYSSMVQTLHDSGLVGLGLMLGFTGGCAWYAFRGYRRASNPRDRAILLGYGLAQGALFFTSQFSSLFWDGFTWVLLGLSVGHARLIIREAAAGPASNVQFIGDRVLTLSGPQFLKSALMRLKKSISDKVGIQ